MTNQQAIEFPKQNQYFVAKFDSYVEVEKQLILVLDILKSNGELVVKSLLEGMLSVSQPIQSNLLPFHHKRDLNVIWYELKYDKKYENKSKKKGEMKNKKNESKSGYFVSKKV
jgi:hypothetical protein